MKSVKLKNTIFLPETKFKMRGNLNLNENKSLYLISKNKILNFITKPPLDKSLHVLKSFTIHDGPPFANGNIHFGTALNKTHKDLYIKYSRLIFKNSYIIPGWDCHGLPIENKITLNYSFQKLSKLKLRLLCKKISNLYSVIQKDQFKRLGISCNWQFPYKTTDKFYETNVLTVFFLLLKKRYVYIRKKPVYWSVLCKTVLAEAEVEYREIVNDSLYFKAEVKKPSLFFKNNYSKVYVLVWTTLPWTIPSNKAILFNKKFKYVFFQINHIQTIYVCSLLFFKYIILKLNFTYSFKIKLIVEGKEFKQFYYGSIFFNLGLLPMINSNYVDNFFGTGFLHVAPSHGLNDYVHSLKFNLKSQAFLTQNSFINNFYMIGGKEFLLINKCKFYFISNLLILNNLLKKNKIIIFEKYRHEYPFCWRSKTPLIFIFVKQIFINLKRFVNNNLISRIDSIYLNKYEYKNKFSTYVKTRPDWCISRQRSWGIPIPLYRNLLTSHLLVRSETLNNQILYLNLIRGLDVLYTKTSLSLFNSLKFQKKTSIFYMKFLAETFDVWFSSGITYLATNKNITYNLYMEGVDQFRGWFQSSFWIKFILKNETPYKKIFTHGFITNRYSEKFSKSTSNVNKFSLFIQTYGSELFRLWSNCEDVSSNIIFSKYTIQTSIKIYKLFRNSIKYLIGMLKNTSISSNFYNNSASHTLHRYTFEKTKLLIIKTFFEYEKMHSNKFINLLYLFLYEILSSYIKYSKNSLYLNSHLSLSNVNVYKFFLLLLNSIHIYKPVLFFSLFEITLFLNSLKYELSNNVYTNQFHMLKWPLYLNINSKIQYKYIFLYDWSLLFNRSLGNLEEFFQTFKIKNKFYLVDFNTYFFEINLYFQSSLLLNLINYNLFYKKYLFKVNYIKKFSLFCLKKDNFLICKRELQNYKYLYWSNSLFFISKNSKKLYY